MRISDWSSDVCSSDLHSAGRQAYEQGHIPGALFLDHEAQLSAPKTGSNGRHPLPDRSDFSVLMRLQGLTRQSQVVVYDGGNSMFASHLWWMLRWLGHENVAILDGGWPAWRSEEHTSELQSLMRISYAVFCLKKKI